MMDIPNQTRILSDGTISTAPNLGWIKLIDEMGNEHDSREYGVVNKTPRVRYSPLSGSVVSVADREEPMFTTGTARAAKTITVKIGVNDERISEDVLAAFCRSGKLIISTHPNLYYNAQVIDAAASEAVSRRMSEISITYKASAYRYLLGEKLRKWVIPNPIYNPTVLQGIYGTGKDFYEPEKIAAEPQTDEVCEPLVYFITQSGALADTIAAECTIDMSEPFKAFGLKSDTIYCIDNARKIFYKWGKIVDGHPVKNVIFADMTANTSGDFIKTKAQKEHTIKVEGHIQGIWIQPNARWNI